VPALHVQTGDAVHRGAAVDLDALRPDEVAVRATTATADDHGAVDALRLNPLLGLLGVGVKDDQRITGDRAPVDAAPGPIEDVAFAKMQMRPVLDDRSL